MQNYYQLDSEEVKRQMGRQELKQWWVAEQAGIHKTTLRRWLSGQIQRVRRDHVEGLARVLGLEPARIVQLD